MPLTDVVNEFVKCVNQAIDVAIVRANADHAAHIKMLEDSRARILGTYTLPGGPAGQSR